VTSPAATRAATPWWVRDHGREDGFLVAYFCMEFGLSERLPVYSGGLGVLAGDHLKAAGDLGVPLVGVGLLYRLGYFRQAIDGEGQEERYVGFDPEAAGLALERGADGEPLTVSVELGGEEVAARIWRADVAGVRLYLLDSDLPANSEEGRAVTDVLYGGDREHRLRQELLLGVGGPRALAALGIAPSVFHVNEGHAAFLALERLRVAVEEAGRPRDEALAAMRASTVFTTHTPVPAGNERFDPALVRGYVGALTERAGFTWPELAELGRVPGDEEFSLTPLALRTAGFANGVSQLHGEVARALWRELPGASPIGAVTNGVHFRSWVGREIIDLLAGAGVELEAPPGEQGWERAVGLDREALAAALARQRRTLVESIGAPGLSPGALTIGFARRFATYKRAGLLFSDPDRLRALLHDPERPVQLVVAGKAHPHDAGGKELIRLVLDYARAHAEGSSVVFLPDYDIALARLIVQGVDVWLNTPRRPQEACGTSGMKAALNGALNLSTLDGWWAEAYRPEIGWAIGGEDLADDAQQDAADARELYRVLEDEVVPAFADAAAWLDRVAASISRVGSRFGADRMVREYTERYYLPAHRLARG
jgi:glycogen phosphorylase